VLTLQEKSCSSWSADGLSIVGLTAIGGDTVEAEISWVSLSFNPSYSFSHLMSKRAFVKS
jgi:hypothetical protein